MSLPIQFYLLIHGLVYGAFIGITLDFVFILKSSLRSTYLQGAMVIVYWLVQIPLVFVYLYQVNEGVFHLYILIFLLFGAIGYFKLMKQPLHRNLEILGKNIYIIVAFLKKLVNLLIISPILFIYKLISDIMKLFLRILKLIFYTPFVKLGKWGSNKKKVKQRVKKTNNNKKE